MAIFMTGDTNGDFSRFSARAFPEQKDLSKADYVISCGDFGRIWDGGELEYRPFTILFVDGNHENMVIEEETRDVV